MPKITKSVLGLTVLCGHLSDVPELGMQHPAVAMTADHQQVEIVLARVTADRLGDTAVLAGVQRYPHRPGSGNDVFGGLEGLKHMPGGSGQPIVFVAPGLDMRGSGQDRVSNHVVMLMTGQCRRHFQGGNRVRRTVPGDKDTVERVRCGLATPAVIARNGGHSRPPLTLTNGIVIAVASQRQVSLIRIDARPG